MTTSYILVGDSQAAGLRAPLRALLERAGWEEVGAAAHVGWTTGRMIASNEGAILTEDHQPDVAIVVLGGNDTPGATYPGKVETLFGQLQPARVVWIGPAAVSSAHPEIAARKARVAEQQRSVALARGFEWIDGRAQTLDLEHAGDGLHFTPVALDLWAARVTGAAARGKAGWLLGVAAGTIAGLAAAWLRRG